MGLLWGDIGFIWFFGSFARRTICWRLQSPMTIRSPPTPFRNHLPRTACRRAPAVVRVRISIDSTRTLLPETFPGTRLKRRRRTQVALKNIPPPTVCTRVYVCVYVPYDNGRTVGATRKGPPPLRPPLVCKHGRYYCCYYAFRPPHTRPPPHSSAIIVSTRCVCTVARTRLYYETVVRGNNVVKSSNARHCGFRFRAKNGRKTVADRKRKRRHHRAGWKRIRFRWQATGRSNFRGTRKLAVENQRLPT